MLRALLVLMMWTQMLPTKVVMIQMLLAVLLLPMQAHLAWMLSTRQAYEGSHTEQSGTHARIQSLLARVA
jgi:hypothetical protein